jgi:hypothetical protein
MATFSPRHIVASSQCPTKAFLMRNPDLIIELTEYEKLLLKFQTQAFENYSNKFSDIQNYK